MTRRVRSLGFAAPGDVAFFDLTDPSPGRGRVRVDTCYSGFSAGTELTFYKGTNPYLSAAWDAELGVFRRDRAAVGYPVRTSGYMEVGRVVDGGTDEVPDGALVALTCGHRSGHTAEPATARMVVLPDDLDPVLGVYVAQMGPICANGLLHAAVEERGREATDLGDGVRDRDVVVTGAGVVGLLIGLFARHHGARSVAVVDPTPQRRAAAAGLGLDVVDAPDADAWLAVKRRPTGGRPAGADIVFQCRGRTPALATALRCLRPQGTVVDLAFYTEGAPDLRLGEEFHHNGLAIRCAQIGRVPRQLADRWDRSRLSASTLDLLRAYGPAIRRHLVTDVVDIDDAPGLVADLGERRRHALTAVFRYPCAG